MTTTTTAQVPRLELTRIELREPSVPGAMAQRIAEIRLTLINDGTQRASRWSIRDVPGEHAGVFPGKFAGRFAGIKTEKSTGPLSESGGF
jgi:hypothetical protein